MFPFRNRLFKELPRWLVNVPGSQIWALVASIGQELDRVAYLARTAWQSYLTTNQPVDALHFSGEVRRLPRYSLDTDQSYRERLHAAPEFYRFLGTSKSIIDTFALLGYTAEVLCEKDFDTSGAEVVWDGFNWDDGSVWDGTSNRPDEIEFWNRFWVRVHGFPCPAWNQPNSIWNEESETWNTSIDVQVLQEFISIVLRCRAAYNLFVGFIFVQEDGSETLLILNLE